ncbi:MAG: hypothetical protein V1833_06650 [Elusimicrobiota bacterium]
MKIKNVVLAVFVCLVFFACEVFAGVKIYPEVQRLVAPPGETIKGNIWVINSGDEKLEVEIQPEDWSKGRRKSSVAWLKIKQKQKKLIVKPKKMKEIKWKIVVPKDAEGDLIAQIFFASVSSEKTGGISIGTRVAQGIYVTVKGTEKPAGEIADFSVKCNNKNHGFAVLFKNTGNVQLTTKGEITLKELQTGTTRMLELDPYFYRPGASFTLWNWLPERLAEGDYESEATVFFADPSGMEQSTKSKFNFNVNNLGEITKRP